MTFANASTPPEPSRPAPRVDISPSQARIVGVVESMPGCTIQEVARMLGFSHPTCSYHLHLLCQKGAVVRARDGRDVRHFLAKARSDPMAYLEALRRDPRRRIVLDLLDRAPVSRMTMNEIARTLNLPFGIVKRTLGQLAEGGYLRLERHKGRYVVHARHSLRSGEREGAAQAPAQQAAPAFVGPAATVPEPTPSVALPLGLV